MLDIEVLCENARYSECLDSVVRSLGGFEVLRLEYESDYQGYVDIDVLLDDGRVFSYRYGYGSCAGCDDWEDRDLTSKEIEEEMKREATYFSDIHSYNARRVMIDAS